MKNFGIALLKVVVRVLISTLALIIVFVLVFLGMVIPGPEDVRGFLPFAFYLLSAWALMPLMYLNITTTAIVSVVWIGIGFHAYTYVSSGTAPKFFPYWCLASGLHAFVTFCKYKLQLLPFQKTGQSSANLNGNS